MRILTGFADMLHARVINKHYRKYTNYKRLVKLKLLDFVVSSLSKYLDRTDIRGLDLGCGEGNMVFPLTYLGYNMVGIDISKEHIKKANNGKVLDAMFLVADIENIEISEKFDFTLCCAVLEYLDDPEKFLCKVNKMLKNRNGILVVSFVNSCGPYCLIFHHFQNNILHKLFPNALSNFKHVFSLEDAKRMIENAGFKILEIKNSDFISFLPLLRRSVKFCLGDYILADNLPHFLASGIYLIATKKFNKRV